MTYPTSNVSNKLTCQQIERPHSLESLQAMRAIAAWLVVFHHYMGIFHSSKYNSWLGEFFSSTGSFGVDIFFVISGFIMSYTLHFKDIGGIEFIKKRLLRIVPVYWFVTLLTIPTIYYFPREFSFTGYDNTSLIYSMLFIPHENPSGLGVFPLVTQGWSLNFEMFFYLWIGLLIILFRKGWFIACVVSLLMLPTVWPTSWPYDSVIGNSQLYEFSLGMLTGLVYVNIRCHNRWKGVWSGWVFLTLATTLYQIDSDWSEINFFWRFSNITTQLSATAFVIAALCFDHQLRKLPTSRLLKHLGDRSYSTYLIHVIVLGIFLHFFGVPTSILAEALLLIAITFTIFIASHLSYQWIETGPLTQSLKRLMFRKT